MSKKITDLTQLSSPHATDMMLIDDLTGGASKKVAVSDLLKTPGQVNFASLLSTIFSGQLTSYTNTGTGGGTGYFINLGGIKLVWGTGGAFTSTTNTTYTVSMPTSFLTSVQSSSLYILGSSTVVSYVGVSSTTSTLTIFVATAATNNTMSWFVIGS